MSVFWDSRGDKMRKINKSRFVAIVMAGVFAFSNIAPAATVIGSNTVNGVTYPDYHSCVAGRNTGGSQANDECFLAFDKFITVNNPVTVNNEVYIDETHRNFHKISAGTPQRYLPFAELLRKGGYIVSAVTGGPTEFMAWLDANPGKTLVIANPLHPSNDPEANWLGTIESAFTDAEIDKLVAWVNAGGSLMLVADHFPFPGAMAKLGAKFGFFMDNGYNFDPQYNDSFLFSILLRSKDFLAGHSYDPVADIMTLKRKTTDLSPDGGTKFDTELQINRARTVKDDLVDIVRLIMVKLGADINSMNFWAGSVSDTDQWFAKGDGLLKDHPIIRGRQGTNESIPWVTSFTGQSFTYVKPDNSHANFTRLMELGKETYTLLTTNQDAYFGPSQSDSESNLVTNALSFQKIAPYTVAKKDTGPRLVSASNPGLGYIADSASLQGAALDVGLGKLVVFGEAGMFTAQIAADGTSQMGFNNPMAVNNQQFVLNTINWLTGNLINVSVAATNNGLPTNSTYMTRDGQTINLEAVVTTVAANVVEFKKYQDDLKNGIYNGNPSYAQTYKANYGSGGGCTLSRNGSGDATLTILFLIAMAYVFRRRRQRTQ